MSLNKAQLIDLVAKDAQMTKVEAEKALKSTIKAISGELSAGGNVTLIGFGTFTTMKRAARTGRSPRSGEPIKIPAKTVPKFRPGKLLKEQVDVKPPEKKGGKKSAKKK